MQVHASTQAPSQQKALPRVTQAKVVASHPLLIRHSMPSSGLQSRFDHPVTGSNFSKIPARPSLPGRLQTKLTVNTPGDSYEQEADRVAEQVMRMPEPQLQRKCACGGSCPDCQKDEDQEFPRLQMKSVSGSSAGHAEAPASVHEVLRSPGQPLDATTRAFMERRFGRDFSSVRVHTDRAAADSARQVNAHAYTVGHDIVFAAKNFVPQTQHGRRLLAHELTHVVQQSTLHGAASSSDFIRSSVLPRATSAAISVFRDPPKGGDKHFDIHPEAMEFLKQKMRDFYELLPETERISLKRNSTVAIGMTTVDGEPRLVYTVANNRTSKAIRNAADKLDLHRWTYETDVQGRGDVGAPNDAEQLMKEFAADEGADLHGVVVSRRACPDCAQSYAEFKGRKVPLDVVEDPIPVPKAPSSSKSQTGAEAKSAGTTKKPKEAKPAQTTKPEPKPAETAAKPAKPEVTKTEAAKPDVLKTEPSKVPAKEPAKPATTSATRTTPKAVDEQPRTSKTSVTEPEVGPEPPSGIRKPVEEVDMSGYPPDREGPVIGRFRDATTIHATVAAIEGAITVVSLATNTDISALGIVQWHFSSEINDASAEFQAAYPEVNILRTQTGLEQAGKAYDQSLSSLQLPAKVFALAAVLSIGLSDKDREAYLREVLGNIARSAGGRERLQAYIDAGDVYLRVASMVEEELSNLHYYNLPKMASDIALRASVLTTSGDQLDHVFYDLLQNPAAWWGPGEYAVLEIQHIAGVMHTLGERMGGLASTISSRAQDYQGLWDELERNQKNVYLHEKMIAGQFHMKTPF